MKLFKNLEEMDSRQIFEELHLANTYGLYSNDLNYLSNQGFLFSNEMIEGKRKLKYFKLGIEGFRYLENYRNRNLNQFYTFTIIILTLLSIGISLKNNFLIIVSSLFFLINSINLVVQKFRGEV